MSKRSRKGVGRHPPAVEIPKDKITEEMRCQFCHMGETKDILQSGKLYKLVSGRTTEYYHYFCCLFSTDGVQAGKDEEGLNGFLLKDLKLELKRGASLKCDFCNKNGATIRCRKKSCKKMYHFSCGALCETPGEYFYIFQGEMASFCHSHGPKQSRPSQLSTDRMCMICFDSCGETAGPGPGKLVSPCCGRTYHRDCVQKAALQAGKASLKCPACNNKDTFNAEMVRCGLYIPHADAQWEMPEYSNFYQFDEMLNSDMRCDSLLCQCPDGPEFSRPGGRFEIVKCQTCGSRGVHVQCGNIDRRRKFFICSDCQPETSDSDTNSEGEELLVQERVEHHERFMKQKLAERDRLIEEELERLRPSQVLYTRDLQVLKSILSEPDPPAPPVLRWSRVGSKKSLSAAGPSRFQLIVPNGATEERINETMSILTEPDPPAPPVLRWSRVGSKKRLPAAAEPPRVEKKKKSLSEAEVLYPRELQVLKQRWRTMETQEERWSGGGCKKSVSEDLQVLDQSSDQDQFPVIGNVCGGSEAKILSDAAVATEDSIEIFDDSDSDLEVIEQKLENS